jgi:uncharacterized protein YndB with AHSA1/START domain
MVAKNKSNEIHIIRLYDAPLEMVWDAWTDPEQVAQWWGPRGFTLTTHSKELKPGGIWHYTMHGPDGVDYPNKTLYHVVEEHARLVYDHGGNDERKPLFRVTALFSRVDGKTRLELTFALPTPEQAEEIRKFIKQAGGDSTWDRLAEYLEVESSGKEKFVINRSFDAPRDVVFEMWTQAEHVARWLPPTGFEMRIVGGEIRPGGGIRYAMAGGEIEFLGRIDYVQIDAPQRLVYTQGFCDAQGKVSRHPLAPVWPASMLTTVEFAIEGPERTRVTVTWEPHGPTTPEELAAFVQARGGMTQGWTGSFDKLEALLEG